MNILSMLTKGGLERQLENDKDEVRRALENSFFRTRYRNFRKKAFKKVYYKYQETFQEVQL